MEFAFILAKWFQDIISVHFVTQPITAHFELNHQDPRMLEAGKYRSLRFRSSHDSHAEMIAQLNRSKQQKQQKQQNLQWCGKSACHHLKYIIIQKKGGRKISRVTPDHGICYQNWLEFPFCILFARSKCGLDSRGGVAGARLCGRASPSPWAWPGRQSCKGSEGGNYGDWPWGGWWQRAAGSAAYWAEPACPRTPALTQSLRELTAFPEKTPLKERQREQWNKCGLKRVPTITLGPV